MQAYNPSLPCSTWCQNLYAKRAEGHQAHYCGVLQASENLLPTQPNQETSCLISRMVVQLATEPESQNAGAASPIQGVGGLVGTCT